MTFEYYCFLILCVKVGIRLIQVVESQMFRRC